MSVQVCLLNNKTHEPPLVPIFFIHRLGSRKVYIGDDVIAQKPTTSFKQVVPHRMALFKIKRPVRAIFQKHHITLL
jgi:hypothetical protein